MCDLGTRDLRTLPKTLVATGAVATPPTEVVARRARRIQAQRRARTAAAGALVVALVATASLRWAVDEERSSRVRLVDDPSPTTTTTEPGPPSARATEGAAPLGPAAPTAPTASTFPPARPELSCRAGDNGGVTDRGVTADAIRVTMTETLHFPQRYTTIDAYDAVKQVFTAVNREGGICGRLLDLDLVNPVWGAAPWDSHSDAVAGIAGPLDENAEAAIVDGRVDRAATPLVSTGLSTPHFTSAWVTPVLPPAVSVARIAVGHAYKELGARSFALVYEDDYLFKPAAQAFSQYIATLPGASVRLVQPLRLGDGSYADEALELARACAPTRCDALLLALSERTLPAWSSVSDVRGAKSTAGFSGLRWSRYAHQCVPLKGHPQCDELHVWEAPTYRADLTGGAVDCPSTGAALTLADSARVGACRLVDALRRVGPDVTRERLRIALDQLAAELSVARFAPDGRRVFDVPARALRPTLTRQDLIRPYELVPFTSWLRDPYGVVR